MLEFFDSHCHLDFTEFDEDRLEVLEASRDLGVRRVLVPGVSLAQSRQIVKFGCAEQGVYIAVGIHPWWVKALNEQVVGGGSEGKQWPKALADLSEVNACVAIGECGLDKAIDTPIELQLAVFEKQIALAKGLGLPLIVHSRKAHNEVLGLLNRYQCPAGGVIHAFSGSLEEAQRYWGLGFYLGVGGTITYERAKKTRAAIKAMPVESLLLETDSPDMPLFGHQGERNCPTFIPAIASALAELREEPLSYIATQTTYNAKHLFAI